MSQNSKIEWTHHTFNPWWGCTKVSPGCANCYAEGTANRYGHDVWGKDAERRFFGDKHWAEPLKWNRDAEAAGERHRVFCASMADVFEHREDVRPHRDRLFQLILDTPHLDWLLLTKRPENIGEIAPENWLDGFPLNVWLGTTVENQEATARIDELLKYCAIVNFLSCEPLLGPIDLALMEEEWPDYKRDEDPGKPLVHPSPRGCGINWVIVGGESGAKARPMHPDWAMSIRDQCQAAGVPFFFKQWGESAPRFTPLQINGRDTARPDYGGNFEMVKVGKKNAGRLLDGREWNEFPKTHTEESACR